MRGWTDDQRQMCGGGRGEQGYVEKVCLGHTEGCCPHGAMGVVWAVR